MVTLEAQGPLRPHGVRGGAVRVVVVVIVRAIVPRPVTAAARASFVKAGVIGSTVRRRVAVPHHTPHATTLRIAVARARVRSVVGRRAVVLLLLGA